MSGYSVNLDALLAFTARMADFNVRAEAIGKAVDGQIGALHEDWLGEGSNSHSEYHQRWMALFLEMRESLADLRESAHNAHHSYHGAAQANATMWKSG